MSKPVDDGNMPKPKDVTVQYHVSDEIPQVVMSEASWISMILVNFVSNAFKHTRRGSVSVSARLSEKRIRIMVADTGAGVPAAMEKHLWQARLVGLAEVRRVPRLAGGRLAALAGGWESREPGCCGQGARWARGEQRDGQAVRRAVWQVGG